MRVNNRLQGRKERKEKERTDKVVSSVCMF